MKKIGILGGMGPEATVLLMKRVIEKTEAHDDCDHIPLLVDNNTQVPSRIDAIIRKNGSSPIPVLCEMAKSLEKNGAMALAMPCNTAHIYLQEIRSSIDIPFISMVEESVVFLKKMKLETENIGILASPAVEISKIFELELEKSSMSPIYVGNGDLRLSVIKEIKSKPNILSISEKLEEIIKSPYKRKLGAILIACSEFSIVSDVIKQKFDGPVLDTLDILATKIIEFSKKN